MPASVISVAARVKAAPSMGVVVPVSYFWTVKLPLPVLAAGVQVCPLGRRTLRWEPAPLCALSALMYAAGEF